MEKLRKRRFVILALIILLFIISCNTFNIVNEGIEEKNVVVKNPKVNMVVLNRLIFNSNICDEVWINEVIEIIEILKDESLKLESIKEKDLKIKEKLNNFSLYTLNVSNSLNDLVMYLDTNDLEIDLNDIDDDISKILVDNIKDSYEVYKNYYTDVMEVLYEKN